VNFVLDLELRLDYPSGPNTGAQDVWGPVCISPPHGNEARSDVPSSVGRKLGEVIRSRFLKKWAALSLSCRFCVAQW
jgi:hypothetical protein